MLFGNATRSLRILTYTQVLSLHPTVGWTYQLYSCITPHCQHPSSDGQHSPTRVDGNQIHVAKPVITHTFSHGDRQLPCNLMPPKRQWVATFSGQNAEGQPNFQTRQNRTQRSPKLPQNGMGYKRFDRITIYLQYHIVSEKYTAETAIRVRCTQISSPHCRHRDR